MLDLAVTAHLYPRLEAERFGAGRLTKIRAQAVSGRACRAVAERIGIPARLEAAGPPGVGTPAGALTSTERVLASVVEALIGACYLAFGYERTAEAVVEDFQPEIEAALEGTVDFKSTLQERLARDARLVVYEVVVRGGTAPRPHVRGARAGRGRGDRPRLGPVQEGSGAGSGGGGA